MSTNAYARLRALLPPSVVLIGRVLEQHESDDTSTVLLPLGVGTSVYAPGVSAGSTIRPRGRTVEVGRNAFIRDGVVESQAPDGDPVELVVGRVVDEPLGPSGLTFNGSVSPQSLSYNVAMSLDLSGYFSDYYPALEFTVAAGALPPGLALDSATGIISGTPSLVGAYAASVQAEDVTWRVAITNSISFSVT
jgi:hypothetical protein